MRKYYLIPCSHKLGLYSSWKKSKCMIKDFYGDQVKDYKTLVEVEAFLINYAYICSL